MRQLLADALRAIADRLHRSEPSSPPPGAARHPSALPRLTVVPGGMAQGRADLQFTYRPTTQPTWPKPPTVRGGIRYPARRLGHGASEGDPDL